MEGREASDSSRTLQDRFVPARARCARDFQPGKPYERSEVETTTCWEPIGNVKFQLLPKTSLRKLLTIGL